MLVAVNEQRAATSRKHVAAYNFRGEAIAIKPGFQIVQRMDLLPFNRRIAEKHPKLP